MLHEMSIGISKRQTHKGAAFTQTYHEFSSHAVFVLPQDPSMGEFRDEDAVLGHGNEKVLGIMLHVLLLE